MYLVYIYWCEIYLLSFLCDVCNEVHEHMQSLSELWYNYYVMITSLKTCGLNIIIHGIFKKDIKFSRKNNIIWFDSYDECD